MLDDWVRRDAPRLDADDERLYDERRPGDHGRGSGGRSPKRSCGRCSAATCSTPSTSVRSLGGLAGESYVDKDLRTLLGEPVDGRFNLALLRQRLARRAAERRSGLRSVRPPMSSRRRRTSPIRRLWRSRRSARSFQPGLIPNTFRATNRPDLPAGARVPAAPLGAGLDEFFFAGRDDGSARSPPQGARDARRDAPRRSPAVAPLGLRPARHCGSVRCRSVDFAYTPRLVELRERAAALSARIMPYEQRCEENNGLSAEDHAEIRAAVLDTGLQAINMPEEWGGAGSVHPRAGRGAGRAGQAHRRALG